MRRRNAICLAMVLGGVMLGAASASAQSGVLEINRTCAIETGCFPGDDPGFPVTIVISGSYRLTSNLWITSASPTQSDSMIEIPANDVELDLGGFRIVCTALLPGATCTGSGHGVDATGDRTTVRNGSVVGMANRGLALGTGGRVVDVSVSGAGSYGLFLGEGAIVQRVSSMGNGSNGIYALSNAIVSDSVATGNGGAGIQVGSGSRIHGSTAAENDGAGFFVGRGSVVTENMARSNEGDGFALSASLLTSNDGGLVKGNVATLNDDYGFDASFSLGGASYGAFGWALLDNVARGNNGLGDQIRGGTEMGQNLCGANNLVCP